MSSNPPPPPTFRNELKELLLLCGPIIASSILLFALNIEDQLIVGHLLEKEDLAAVAFGTTFFNLFWYLLLGLMTAVDTYSAQAFGAQRYADVGLWAQRGLFICLVASVPIILFSITCTETIVANVFHQNEVVSAKAALFVHWLMPGLPFLITADVLRRWLQVQNHLRPAITTGIAVNLFNIGLNFALVNTYGLIGSPVATSLSRVLQVILLLAIIKYRGLHLTNHTWPAWSWSKVLQKKPLLSFLTVAAPGAAMLLLEAGAFETSTLIVGALGNLDILDAHFVLLSLCGFSFVAFPLSASIAGSIRVGTLLGARKPLHAKMAAWICVALGVGFMAVNGILFASCKDVLGYIFTDDSNIVEYVSKIAGIAACFQIVDGIQGTTAGALRGCGQQKKVMMTNLLGFWIIGIPTGSILAFQGNLSVYGVWWGLTVGLFVAAMVSSWILYKVDWVNESVLAIKRVSEGESGNDIPGIALLIPEETISVVACVEEDAIVGCV